MSEESALQGSLAALTQFSVGDQTLDRVAAMTGQAVPPAAFVGITMMSNDRPATTVFTDRAAPEIDQAQYEVGHGPCLDSFRRGETVGVESTPDDRRWPEFSAACVDHGMLSTFSVPLNVDGTTHGALNLYARSQRAFGEEEQAPAALFGAHAAIVLANAVAYWGARARAEQLEQALNTRRPIEQAEGIIMATMRRTADRAFEILVDQSQRENRKLNQIAADIVARMSRQP